MARVVLKFGGSSVADADKLSRVAGRIRARRDAGDEVVVVVSAMGDTTDELLALAKRVAKDPPRRELDMLLTCGERISMALLSMCLQELGVPAKSFTGSQSGIITDEAHSQARVVEVRPQRLLEALAAGCVVIVAGYQGVSRAKEITTLGRGGSDTTAVALAAALGADCEIYSDVDGVLSADPRVVPEARRLDSLSFEEMQALAVSGAKVLNAQAVELAARAGIVIHARSAHAEGRGTTITRGDARSDHRVKGVTSERELLVIEVERPDSLPGVLALLDARGVKLRAVHAWEGGASLLVPLLDVHGVDTLTNDLRRLPHLRLRSDLASVTLVGAGAGESAALVSGLLSLMSREGVSCEGLFTSGLQVTALISRDRSAWLVQRVHAELVAPPI